MPIELVTLDDPGGNGLTNNSSLYWLIFDCSNEAVLSDSQALPSVNNIGVGVVNDVGGTAVGRLKFACQSAQQTSATSGVYGFSAFAYRARYVIVPPAYTFSSFDHALAYQGTLSELSELM